MAATLVLAAWCAGAGGGYLGVLSFPPMLTLVAAGGLALAALGARVTLEARPAWVPALLLATATGLAGVARGAAGRPPAGPESVAWHVGETVVAVGTVSAAAAPSGGDAANPAGVLQGFHLDVQTIEDAQGRVAAQGSILVQARGQAEAFDGQKVAVRGRLSRLRELGPGGMSGYADRLERQGVLAEMSSATVHALERPPPLSPGRIVASLRHGLITALRDTLPEPEATIALGEVAGIRGSLPPAVDADLVDSGLVHILAISGIKVAIVAGLLRAVAVPALGRRGAALSIAGVGVYTLVGGASASAIRSALMGSLGMVGSLLRRDTALVRSLLLAAAAMLALRPSLVADLSFQYSFLGVLGIHLFADRFAAPLPHVLRESLAVTLAAQLGTLPLTAHYFGVVPLAGPVANALVLPTLPAGIAAGLLLALAHGVGALAGEVGMRLADASMVPLGALTMLQARAALVVAHWSHALPGAALHLGQFGDAATGAYYAALAVVAAGPVLRLGRLRLAAAAAAAAVLVLLLLSRPDGRMHVVFAGGITGPVAVVIAPDGATMLIGTGTSAAALAPAIDIELPGALPLPGTPRRIDAMALTGSTREEAGGLGALTSRTVDTVIAPTGMTGTAAVDAVARIRERGARLLGVGPGDVIPWHGLELAVHPAGAPGEVELEVRWGHARVLVVSSADARNLALLPPGDYAVIAVGSGAVAPGLEGVGAVNVVVQNAGASTAGTTAAPAHPVARGLAQAAGNGLWETSRDGALRLSCDDVRCARG